MVDNQVQYKRTCDYISKGQRPWGYSKIPPPWGVRPPCPHPAHGNHYAAWRGRHHLQPPTRAWKSHRSRHHTAFCYPEAGCLSPYLEHLHLFLECLGSPYRLSDAEAVELVQKERESLHGSKSTTWSHRVSWLCRCVCLSMPNPCCGWDSSEHVSIRVFLHWEENRDTCLGKTVEEAEVKAEEKLIT